MIQCIPILELQNMHHPDDIMNSRKQKEPTKGLLVLGLLALAGAIWFFLRTGRKPSRINYPCQQASLLNIELFKTAFLGMLPSIAAVRSLLDSLKPVGVLAVLVASSVFICGDFGGSNLGFIIAQEDDYTRVPIELSESTAVASVNTSDLFLLQNVYGSEGDMNSAISALVDWMSMHGLYFYNTSTTPSGLIGSNDVIILKVNGQWSYRGGSNTDLVNAIISVISEHPEGFTGAIAICDNGQGRGSLDRTYNNAFNHSQSFEDLVQMFPSVDVSTVLWDDLRYTEVEDYDQGDFTNGYVLSSTWNSDTEIYTSYPKFTTNSGLHISFKNGVWENSTGYNSNRLKVINTQVLKTHLCYGVTGCVKNYMGVPKGHILSSIDNYIPHEHFSIAHGGLGTLMVETRVPILNILDMVWVNAHPLEASSFRGPDTGYARASFVDIVGISQDAVALDYWSSKNILIPTAQYLGYTNYSSLDPDYEPLSAQYTGDGMVESFCNYLKRTRDILVDAGFQATTNESEMNVYVQKLDNLPPINGKLLIDPLIIIIALPLFAIIIASVLVVKKRRT